MLKRTFDASGGLKPSGNSFLSTMMIFYDFDPILLCRWIYSGLKFVSRFLISFRVDEKSRVQVRLRRASSNAFPFINLAFLKMEIYSETKRVKRLSCCALEDDRTIWKCTCSKRHYMTLNINSSVKPTERVQGECGKVQSSMRMTVYPSLFLK